MRLLRGWTNLFFVAAIFLLVIVALYRSGRPAATHNPVPLLDLGGQADRRSPIEAMYERLVVLTAFSSSHLRQALDMIGSVQKYLPHAKIIVYDIGLTAEERGNVSKFCNVELRYFNFTKYPPHVKMLGTCAWKPLILQELVDQEYDLILYGDGSLRLTAYNICTGLECLLDFPFLNLKLEYHSTISLTHKMIEYFQFPPSRQYMARWRTVQGGCWLLVVNDITREKLIAPWVDCALREECITPKGARKNPCNFTLNAHNDGTYVGCHRYDQSALNIILAKNFGLKVWDKVVRKDVTNQFATVHRGAQGIYPVNHHPHCN